MTKQPKSLRTANSHTRRVPSQKRAIERQQLILNGAKKILNEKTLSAFTMREVAKVSGVGLGTLYDYFPSKSSILYWLLKERITGRIEILDKHTINITGNKPFREIVDAYNRDMQDAKMWSRMDIALFGVEHNDKALKHLRNEYHERLAKRYCSFFQANGSDWPDEDLKTVARYLIRADILNIELQLSAPVTQRGHYRHLTYAAFISAVEMTAQPYKASSK